MDKQYVTDAIRSGKIKLWDTVVAHDHSYLTTDQRNGVFRIIALIKNSFMDGSAFPIVLMHPDAKTHGPCGTINKSAIESWRSKSGIHKFETMDDVDKYIGYRFWEIRAEDIKEIIYASDSPDCGSKEDSKVSSQGRFLSGIDKVLNHNPENSGLEFL